MRHSVWQIGIDIQPHQILAVAACQQITGWQLRQWWKLPLPPGIFCESQLQQPELLSDTLRHWQQQLPSRYRLLCALPAALILQATLPLSDQQKKTEISWVIQQYLPKLFPLPTAALAYDYYYPDSDHSSVLITVSRRSVVDEWLVTLRNAQLFPCVLEVSPCVLRSLANQQQQNPLSLLLWMENNHWVAISPPATPCQFILLPLEDSSLLNTAYHWCINTCKVRPTNCLLGGTICNLGDYLMESLLPINLWDPFIHCKCFLTDLPTDRQLFAIACGLATRPYTGDS